MKKAVTIMSVDWGDQERLIRASTILFLVVNVAFLLLRIPYAPFDSDEFQHLHTAWLISGGEILYRDFWEHHGPLYSLTNGAINYLIDAGRSLTTAFWFRAMNAAVTAVIFYITYTIARMLALPGRVALVSVAILSSLVFLQDNGTEVRPDPMQTMFWLLGLLLVMRNFRHRSSFVLVLAGATFCLSVLSNTKAGIGPFSIFIFYIFGRRLHQLPWPIVIRNLVAMFIGFAAVFCAMLSYFYFHGAASEFFYWNYLWNIKLSLFWFGTDTSAWVGTESALAWVNLKFFLTRQLPLVLATSCGFFLWIRGLLSGAGEIDRRNGWLLVFVLLGTSVGWLLNLYSQYFLMFLPLMAIFGSYGLFRMSAIICRKFGGSGPVIVALVVALFCANLIFSAFRETPFMESPELKSQRRFTEKLVSETDPAQPFGVLWNTCGGYMFNRNLQYYWIWLPGINSLTGYESGEDPFGKVFIEALEARQVPFIVGTDDWVFDRLPEISRSYVMANYTYAECLWTRK